MSSSLKSWINSVSFSLGGSIYKHNFFLNNISVFHDLFLCPFSLLSLMSAKCRRGFTLLHTVCHGGLGSLCRQLWMAFGWGIGHLSWVFGCWYLTLLRLQISGLSERIAWSSPWLCPGELRHLPPLPGSHLSRCCGPSCDSSASRPSWFQAVEEPGL